MLGLSLLLHIGLLAFMPGFGIFLPLGDTPFIEIETISLEPEAGGEAEIKMGELTLEPTLNVSAPGTFESLDLRDEWDRAAREREPDTLEFLQADELRERPVMLPDSRSVSLQTEWQQEIQHTIPEDPMNFQRPAEPAPAEEPPERAEQPFEVAAIREEAPLAEHGHAFIRSRRPELPENSLIRRALRPENVSKIPPSSSPPMPARTFQTAVNALSRDPELQLPQRRDLSEADEDILALLPETPPLRAQNEAKAISGTVLDFHLRPLPGPPASGTPVFLSQESVTKLRPEATEERMPQQRHFRQKELNKEVVVAQFPRVERPLLHSDEGIVEPVIPNVTQQSRNSGTQERVKADDAVLPFSAARQCVKESFQAEQQRPALFVEMRRRQPELSQRARRNAGVGFPAVPPAPPADLFMAQASVSDVPDPPEERFEKFIEERQPRKAQAVMPAPADAPGSSPVFSVKRATLLDRKDASGATRPFARFVAERQLNVQRQSFSAALSAPTARSFGTQRAGLLPVGQEELLSQFGEEKAEREAKYDRLEEAVSRDSSGRGGECTIEGPASDRKVIYKPARLPEVTIEMEVVIRLKFWVMPDGSVGDVVPLQRGDIRLERAAIQYLKSWRFNSVAGEHDVWGIVPIRYKIR
ncbi:hypothetical protein CSB45_09355 [candidate division KSB3 bacterium]|uniref:TonB C-terminal domain-containing protein n=1 Tax=candidate division KSB3 bacterium TaxID=2044937 RepID=A0A2G6E4P7_9BACT|nr:MAG: hypothetical protein CSB45_09355 [candidate division KSB3 bacterium]PIE29468.1 MAG: hypothetical protein CSA57_08720 [candidate division KSB3 bacterium]